MNVVEFQSFQTFSHASEADVPITDSITSGAGVALEAKVFILVLGIQGSCSEVQFLVDGFGSVKVGEAGCLCKVQSDLMDLKIPATGSAWTVGVM